MDFEGHIFVDMVNRARTGSADKSATDIAVRDYLDAKIASYALGADFDSILATSRHATRDFRLSEARMAEYDRVIEACKRAEENFPVGGYAGQVADIYSSSNKLGWNARRERTENDKVLLFKARSA